VCFCLSGHVEGLHHDSSDKKEEAEEIYYSDSDSFVMNEDESTENREEVKDILNFSNTTSETAERGNILVNNTATVMSSEVNTSVINAKGCIFSYTETLHQDMPHPRSRTSEENQACIYGAASVSTEQHSMKVTPTTHQQQSFFHSDMLQMMQLSLYETLQKYCIESDVLELIASRAVTVLEEEMWGVLRSTVLDRTLRKVAGLRSDSENRSEVKEDKAAMRMFQALNEISLSDVSEEWRQRMSHITQNGSVACHGSRELDGVEQVNQLQSRHTSAVEGRVNKTTQTVSTGSVLFLKLLSDS
jgi:hypothetical protein